ncbi:hypothetical protein [Myroides odoratimimus]|uniref:PBSX family phage terminase, large subunit n=1 Tax=Myroides odoratimimus CIP 101113 TaxID=883154 RepID=A0AAV3F5X9_9FLAO|nr:hypothetical protein [Myroides odoratimimus]EHO13817.1 hypothetical protein HMPREF9715_00891 [Myroides odoratimimus CIP 101113]
MSRKTHVNLDDKEVKQEFASLIKQVIDLIAPKDLFFIGGRATGKTTDIIAERSQMIIHDMPRSMQILVSDTYVNAMKNIVPSIILGWENKGWKRGVHFVTDIRPPLKWKTPYKPVETYRHSISTWNGVYINLGSLDQPSGLAGGSYQHMYGDEARILKFDKLKKVNPALRGDYPLFGHSVFYCGRTFTTDIPNIADGDDDWILQQEQYYDPKKAELALQTALVLNEIRTEIICAYQDGDYKKMNSLKKNLVRWTERWVRSRKDLTFFYMVSSFVNVGILSESYFKTTYEALGIEEFKSSVLSLKSSVKKGEKFYHQLGDVHFYSDGILPSFYEGIPLTDAEDFELTSIALRHINHEDKLECGFDFGDMISMPVAQEQGNKIRVLTEFWTLPPESSREIAMKFTRFFRHHKRKVLDMYYDRSGNQYQNIGRDWVTEIANFIREEGWVVNLMNRNQATILQSEEYTLVNNILGRVYKDLPEVLIDRFLCKNLKSSLELTKTIIKVDKKGSKTIHKDKSSEKLPMHMRPMYSTNFSDSFKYLICRRKYQLIVTGRKYLGAGEDPSSH